MSNKILSLLDYEKKVSKRKHFGFLKFYLIIMVIFTFVITEDVQNSTSNIGDIYEANEVWGEYWFNYYKLNNYIDPVTNKKLKLRKVKNLGLSVAKWESGINSNQITWEKSVKGNSYGQYALLSSTAKTMGWNGKNPKELLDPHINAQYSLKFLCIQIKKYEGDIIAGLAAYNGGKYRLNKEGKIKNQNYIDGVYPLYVNFNKTIMND